ncbi:oxidoreductase [Wenzhouxiangella sp. XN24]|uniref:oxidoreductase n=1 Tax=Wenzhouxiangella sp. XN24 TaxID=2713569 RepID=UPI0013EAF170|nr:oxidoreductase [Wenzhouxiangella sp. XN24]NGX15104.1 SDR family NAD(P)-dependent oxidoreductase [Wenzhouxiangella sp. XN24]
MNSGKKPTRIVDSGFSDWRVTQLPDLHGRRYLITGGNSGIGFDAARHLAGAGADLVLACRSVAKGEDAAEQLRKEARGSIDVVELDLSDLSSIRQAAATIREKYDKLHGLINNAGVMQTPESRTVDGFEMQVGTNHLGHFLLAGLLIDHVEAAEGRVVVVSSLVHRLGVLDLDDLMSEKKYDPTRAYIQSKAANIVFALELDRRLKAAGRKAICIACHPGYSDTRLQSTGPKGFLNALYKLTNPLFAQSSSQGAVPTVLAAAGAEAKRGAYYGPQRMQEARGPVGDARVAAYALDRQLAAELWRQSEALVNFEWRL